MARLVNKQFNTPIGLYSEQNIKEIMERDAQILANGAVGINFQNPAVGKPANLQNSAVLRMLEEEESRQRQSSGNGYYYDSERPLRDQIKWPPPDFEHKNQLRSSFKDVIKPGVKRVAWPPPAEGEQPAVQSQGGPQYPTSAQSPQNNYSTSPQPPLQQQQTSGVASGRHQQQPLRPLDITNGGPGSYHQQQSPQAVASPAAGALNQQSPLGFRPATPNRPWTSVQSPVSPQPFYGSTAQQQQAYQQQQQQRTSTVQQQQSYQQQQTYSQQHQQYQSSSSSPSYQSQSAVANQQQQQSYRPGVLGSNQVTSPVPFQQQPQQQQPGRQFEPPATTITLRQQAPVSQAPPPVVTSQPATATLKGGKNLRGDLKWPPETVREQIAEENRQRMELARGPAFRPRLHRKDYGPFFAQHALNTSYPGYKVPPGTQFYDHKPVF